MDICGVVDICSLIGVSEHLAGVSGYLVGVGGHLLGRVTAAS